MFFGPLEKTGNTKFVNSGQNINLDFIDKNQHKQMKDKL